MIRLTKEVENLGRILLLPNLKQGKDMHKAGMMRDYEIGGKEQGWGIKGVEFCMQSSRNNLSTSLSLSLLSFPADISFFVPAKIVYRFNQSSPPTHTYTHLPPTPGYQRSRKENHEAASHLIPLLDSYGYHRCHRCRDSHSRGWWEGGEEVTHDHR